MIALPSVLDEKVLVLNRLYTAIRVISARRAFVMLCKDVAEVISVEEGRYLNYDFESWTEVAALQRQFEPDAHAWIRTPRLEIAVPKIIRLLGYDRLPRQQVKLNRRNLYARDANQCQYCGSRDELTFDHLIPRSRGGRTTWQNVVAACAPCNLRKGGRLARAAGMTPRRAPVQPSAHRLQENGRQFPPNFLHQSWRDFLYWDTELEPG